MRDSHECGTLLNFNELGRKGVFPLLRRSDNNNSFTFNGPWSYLRPFRGLLVEAIWRLKLKTPILIWPWRNVTRYASFCEFNKVRIFAANVKDAHEKTNTVWSYGRLCTYYKNRWRLPRDLLIRIDPALTLVKYLRETYLGLEIIC